MSNNVVAGIVLGILVEIWTAIVIAARWHTDPNMMWLFFLVIPIQILVVILALRTHAATAPYGRQLGNGFALSLVAAAVVFAGSWLLTTVVFPEYFPQIRASAEAMLLQMGRSPADVAAELQKNRSMYDPVANATSGAIGTAVTGLVVSAIAAVFLRRRGPRAATS